MIKGIKDYDFYNLFTNPLRHSVLFDKIGTAVFDVNDTYPIEKILIDLSFDPSSFVRVQKFSQFCDELLTENLVFHFYINNEKHPYYGDIKEVFTEFIHPEDILLIADNCGHLVLTAEYTEVPISNSIIKARILGWATSK